VVTQTDGTEPCRAISTGILSLGAVLALLATDCPTRLDEFTEDDSS
jgi:hypothetical protein